MFVLHIDPWLSHQSEILSTERTCENNVVDRKCVGVTKWYMHMPTECESRSLLVPAYSGLSSRQIENRSCWRGPVEYVSLEEKT